MNANRHHSRNPAARITPAQITATKMGQNALGISDEDYRATLWTRYQVDSCRDLNQEQASDQIEDYISRGFVLIQPAAKAKRAAKYQKHPRPTRPVAAHGFNTARPVRRDDDKVVCLARPEEIDKVNAIAALIEWRAENGLALFLEKRMKIKGGKVRTGQDAYLAIEGLKKMFENWMKAKYGNGWWIMWFDDVKIRTYIAEHCPTMYQGPGYARTVRSLQALSSR